ncbi:MAG: hypothetical protein HKL85_05535 [Acidimicrobiaceae bacterium]|nr:hypothetical protein [Acidimicrobiaceae bacterium]
MDVNYHVGPSRRDQGASLLGLLLVLIILGVMAAVAVSAVGGKGGTALPIASHTPPASVGEPSNVAIQAALSVTCVADYQTLSTAVQVYATLHGANPPAGTSWVAGVQSGSSLLQTWPSDPGHFTFTWNGASLVVVPRHGVPSTGSAGSTNASSGCYAALA